MSDDKLIKVYFGPLDMWMMINRTDLDKLEYLHELVVKSTPRRSALMKEEDLDDTRES